jgi:riboflavin transporter FmnP
MNDLMTWAMLSAIGFILTIVLVALFGLPTMLLWNYLMPGLFGLQTITFSQSVALNALCSILFKSNLSTNSKKD